MGASLSYCWANRVSAANKNRAICSAQACITELSTINSGYKRSIIERECLNIGLAKNAEETALHDYFMSGIPEDLMDNFS